MHSNKAMQSQKTEGWEGRLDDLWRERESLPFIWGKNDCALAACDAVKVMTDRDPADFGRGKYSTKYGAYKVMHRHSNDSLFNTFSKIFEDLGFEEVDEVEFGDIAFVRIQNLDEEASRMFGGVTLVIGYNDTGSVVCPGKDNLVLIEQYELVRAWRL